MLFQVRRLAKPCSTRTFALQPSLVMSLSRYDTLGSSKDLLDCTALMFWPCSQPLMLVSEAPTQFSLTILMFQVITYVKHAFIA